LLLQRQVMISPRRVCLHLLLHRQPLRQSAVLWSKRQLAQQEQQLSIWAYREPRWLLCLKQQWQRLSQQQKNLLVRPPVLMLASLRMLRPHPVQQQAQVQVQAQVQQEVHQVMQQQRPLCP
jgi:hypothetical protein